MKLLKLRVAAVATITMIGLAGCTTTVEGSGTTLAKPFDALPEPQIQQTMSVDEAKAFVEKATLPTTDWNGPTEGPVAVKEKQTIAYVSSDQSYVSYVNWGTGVEEAAEVLGWDVVTYDGKGTVSGNLSAMQQAVASNPVAIVTSADASALQQSIEQSVSAGIPVIGIHASAFPGPDPKLNLFDNISSDPAQIGLAQAAYVIADSNGEANVAHLLDNSYAIARFKAEAAETPIKNLATATFLEEVNIPVAEQSTRIPTAISGLLSAHGNNFYVTTCCDNFYTYVASALRASNVPADGVKLIGADGAPSAYDMIRKGQYQVATVPEPSTLFGYQAVDSIVRAMAGEKPAVFSQPTFLVTKDNVDTEGGDRDQYIPSNGFACHYSNIWLGTSEECSVG